MECIKSSTKKHDWIYPMLEMSIDKERALQLPYCKHCFKKKNEKILVGIQKSGRLHNDSTDFLHQLGFKFDIQSNKLKIPVSNYEIDIILLRDDDIPFFVEKGIVDIAIVGKNILIEKELPDLIARDLPFGKCRLSIAIPEKQDIAHLDGLRIATTYPNTLKNYLEQESVDASIFQMTGSVELATELGIADAICDLVGTGKTLLENNLKELDTLLESHAVLIKNKNLSVEKLTFFNKFFISS